MNLNTRSRLRWALAFGAGVLLGASVVPVTNGVAAERVEYRVVPVNDVPFGARGAAQYQALLERLAAEGWRHDHTLPGFVVFRR